ncbi:Nn.00g100630.m01.CDS01 [Neocucurbitaria sp. VM-36]
MDPSTFTANAPHNADSGPSKNTEVRAQPKSSSAGTSMRCPDPSAHQTKNSALQNHASAAALYSTSSNSTSSPKAKEARSVNPLGPDGKLSSASAATSLKYARAHDLPSFPVVGIDTKSSAGAAALLANQNKKSPEWWKPEQSAAAGKAALLANDYKMAPLWQPEASAAGSKAALLAHRDGGKMNLWAPEASAEGNSAANIAMRKNYLGPNIDYGYTDQGRKNAFTAATGAHSASGRKRAQSNPVPPELYPDSKNSARNALNAATIAHSPSLRAKPQATPVTDSNRLGSGAMQAARIQHAKSISRDMYTSTPPVALEVDEKKHNDALRASAISMAKKMYDVQQQNVDRATGQSAARTGATAAHSQKPATDEGDIKQQAMRYIGIQEAAQKLAQERLAKIGYDENAAYRSYYGYEQPTRSKLSIRRGRNRAYSTSDTAAANDSDSDEDDFRSRRIRSQMEQLNQQVADLDSKKRNDDRKSLLAAAQRKVQAQMQAQDKKIYDETGKMSPAMINEWDEKARQRALANSEARMENHGKVHIGNGKWMDQGDIDAIAQARIQPTLDEITEKTEKRLAEDERRRAEEEERRLDLEEKRRRERIEKERAAEIKAEEKQARDEEKRLAKTRAAEEKTAARQEKEAAKQEREAEKTKKAEDERLAKEDRRKSKEAPRAAPDANSTMGTAQDHDDLYQDPTSTTLAQHTAEHESSDPTSPVPSTSPGSSKGFKSLLHKLKRRSKPSEADDKNKEKAPGFIGGAALRSSTSQPTSQAYHESTEGDRPTNLGDVEPTGGPQLDEDRYSDVSSLSSDYGEGDAVRGRSAERIVSGATVTSEGTDFEEAKDHFDEGLAPPPAFSSDADKVKKGGSPNRDSKFHEVGI